MTKEEFESRFDQAWDFALSSDEIESLAKESANSQNELLTVAHFLMSHQKNAVKSVLKAFLLTDSQ